MIFFSKLKEHKKNTLFLKHKLNFIFYTYLCMVSSAIIFLLIFNHNSANMRPLIISICIVMSIFTLVNILFKKYIYDPIKKIEKAMEVISRVDNIADYELVVDEKHELFEIASYLNKMIFKIKDFANREYKATLLVKQAELNALQTQINPHFLYNTLDSIRGLALIENQQNIAKMTKALSGLFRYSISNTNDMTTLREELKNIDNYMTIQQLRFSDKFLYVIDLDLKDESNILECKLPKLSIQPIVENAVYHGLETKIGQGTIIISAYITEKRIVISIEDDGIGISEDAVEKLNEMFTQNTSFESVKNYTKGIALINVNERIKLFFGEAYGLNVTSTKNIGTTVEIILPIV